MFVSLVVPCYNEEAVIGETHRRLVAVLETVAGLRFEVIYVDDGSIDETPELLGQLHASDRRVRVVRLSRNFGHQVALSAGLEHASGDAVVVIDADLQDPPEVIPEMLARWRDGYEVVYGLRIDREGETAFKIWTAKIFYRLINRLSKVQIPADVGDFRLMDRRVVEVLLAMPERDRFVRGMVSWVGFRQVAVMYRRAARRAGESKYPLLKMLRFAADGVVSFSFAPLRLAVWVGFLAIGVAFAGIVYAMIVRLYTNDWVRGWASIFTAILFLGGIQLVTLGIVGEYVGRIYAEVKRRPLYVVEKRLGFAPLRDEESAAHGAGKGQAEESENARRGTG
ncbi:MAG TPA: glycosyltransferase family 2 protein [Pyrinomonadaceae bacterium]|jgi:dolichol-phosphate mannosyltransferase|nr:glycosyltransferase family 2 protein [Pyrinomonadaceae bacterium]